MKSRGSVERRFASLSTKVPSSTRDAMRSGAGSGKWYPLACRNNHEIVLQLLGKTIFPGLRTFGPNSFGDTFLDFTVTFEYLGLLNNAIFKISLSVPQGEDVHLVDSTFYENLGKEESRVAPGRENAIDENHCFIFIKKKFRAWRAKAFFTWLFLNSGPTECGTAYLYCGEQFERLRRFAHFLAQGLGDPKALVESSRAHTLSMQRRTGTKIDPSRKLANTRRPDHRGKS